MKKPDSEHPALLPCPQYVSVPVEPTEEMTDAPRQIILYAETPGRHLHGLRRHLLRCGVDYSFFPEWAKHRDGHLTKGSIAILVYKAMLAAAPQNTRAHPRQDQQERDAKRYQWLHQFDSWSWTKPPLRAISFSWFIHCTKEDVDAAIDAAIAASSQDEEKEDGKA